MHFYVHFTWRSEMAYIQKVKRKKDTAYRVFILVDKDKRLTKTFALKVTTLYSTNSSSNQDLLRVLFNLYKLKIKVLQY